MEAVKKKPDRRDGSLWSSAQKDKPRLNFKHYYSINIICPKAAITAGMHLKGIKTSRR